MAAFRTHSARHRAASQPATISGGAGFLEKHLSFSVALFGSALLLGTGCASENSSSLPAGQEPVLPGPPALDASAGPQAGTAADGGQGGANEDSGAVPLPPDAAAVPSAEDAGELGAPEAPPTVPGKPCAVPTGVNNSPKSIAEMVTLVQALPLPLTLPCLVQTLERPLKLQASSSPTSGQPAQGDQSPRLFLLNGPLIVSVVPEGIGRPLLELGERVSAEDSVKAEIKFPLSSALEPEKVYTTIQKDGGTICRGCHGQERAAPGFPDGAFASRALQPGSNRRVSFDDLKEGAEICEGNAATERCAMLLAIFAHGDVSEGQFPEEYGSGL